MAPAVLGPLCWAACLAVPAVRSQAVADRVHQDAFGLLQTDLITVRSDLDRDVVRPKLGKRKGGPSELQADRLRPAASRNSTDANATESNSTAANATVAVNSTVNSSSSSGNATTPAEEPVKNWCGFEAQRGFLTAYTKPASNDFLIDLTEAFKRGPTVRFVVTAMTVAGTYTDGSGYLSEYASPMEETANTMFEFRMNPDNISVDVFKPQLDIRTSDREMITALKRGIGNGRFDNLKTYGCQPRPVGVGAFFMRNVEESDNKTAPASYHRGGGVHHKDLSLLEEAVVLRDIEANTTGNASSDAIVSSARNASTGANASSVGNATVAANATATANTTAAANATAAGNATATANPTAAANPTSEGAAGSGGSTVPPRESRTIISGSKLIGSGFFVAPSVKTALSYRLLKVKVFEQNIDVTVEYTVEGNQPLTIGFSLVQLPETPMRPRPSDDRLLYFTTDYRDLGEHETFKDELQAESVDRKVSTIWRYNIPRLPTGQIRIHIDPTVPKRWRKWFRLGVEAWNEAFELIGKPKAVRAVLPEDEDWPQDYDISDARYSTISWTVSRDVVSMGIAKVDPRSGEIIKSDIIMSDGWVQAWLGDLDLLAPNFTSQLQETRGFRFEARSDASVIFNAKRVPGRLKMREEWGQKISLLALARGEPMQKMERDEVLGKGLQNVVTHETGHILGLRHNFKGSLGVTYACIRSASCSATNGLTASVMDYVPVNLPTEDEPDVHLFTPVLGGYDKLAIQYGYMEVHSNASDANSTVAASSRSKLDLELRDVLRQAEKYETCYDSDRIAGQDPSCMAYDISSDPLQAYEDEIKRLAAVQRNLLNTSVMPGAPYTHYGAAVDQVLMLARNIGIKLVAWVGGVQNSYVNRRLDGSRPNKVARKPLPENVQKRALGLMMQLLRLDKAGLLPPAESMPYLVSATDGSGSVGAIDLDSRTRSITRTLIAEALDPHQLLRLHAQERLEAGQEGASFLSVGEFMAKFVKGVLGDGLDVPSPSEWELHRLLVKGLAQVYKSSAVPEEVRGHAMHHLTRLRSQAEAALLKFELGGNEEEEETSVQRLDLLKAHVAGLHQQLTSAICDDGTSKGCDSLESAAAPLARLGFSFGTLALAIGVLLAQTP